MKSMKLTVIGGGNMGRALVQGLVRSARMAPQSITVVDVVPEKLEALRREFKVRTSMDPRGAVRGAQTVILAVKPRLAGQVLDSLRGALLPGQLIISIVTGLELSALSARTGKDNPVVRVMPNLGATVGAGVSAMAVGRTASSEDAARARAIFEAVGEVVLVEEDQMDAVTGLSGSGPAYIFLIIEALADGGVKVGLPRDVALKLAVQTVLGAARLVAETGLHPAVLKDQVTTPGGTTIAGLQELEERGLRAALMRAVAAAADRARALRSATQAVDPHQARR